MFTKWTRRCAVAALTLLPALALALPASAQPPVLSNSEEPGSAIVFPLFNKGSVTVDGVALPTTTIEVGIVCPGPVGSGTCTENQKIKLHFHWVCPQASESSSQSCKSTDFDVKQTVYGKAVFTANGTPAPAEKFSVPAAPCPSGYLIGYVVNTSDQAIKFDGLIGNAEIRNSPTSVASYAGITIQADPALALNARIAEGPNGGLIFDGAPGHYTQVTGQISGDVKYDDPSHTNGPSTQGALVMLTLDVLANRPNEPTFVDFDFFSEQELDVSESTFFICWTEQALATIDGSNLNVTGMGTQRGTFMSDQATNVNGGGVTLLGLVDTFEDVGAAGPAREYIFPDSNNSIGVPTTFVTNGH